MFISQMIGPVARTVRQDLHREHAAERRIARARASARAANAAAGVSQESAALVRLARVYLPPMAPIALMHRQSRIRRRNSSAAGEGLGPSTAAWLKRVVHRLSDRWARTATS